MVAIAGAIIRQRTGKFEYPLFAPSTGGKRWVLSFSW
jgi:hypothetical protein